MYCKLICADYFGRRRAATGGRKKRQPHPAIYLQQTLIIIMETMKNKSASSHPQLC